MAAISPARAHQRAKAAALSRFRPNDPELIETRRSLRALRLEEFIQKTLAEAPRLTDEQLHRLADIIRPA
jgi:hypothetical protein